MLSLIHRALADPDLSRPAVALPADRFTLAKRRWRGTAADGVEFGFQLEAPLKHGDVFWQSTSSRYVIEQQPEPVIEIALDIASSAAAGIGWAIGNLHLELSAERTRLLAPDEPAVRQLLARLQVPYRTSAAIFRPGQFARGEQVTHELGASHRH